MESRRTQDRVAADIQSSWSRVYLLSPNRFILKMVFFETNPLTVEHSLETSLTTAISKASVFPFRSELWISLFLFSRLDVPTTSLRHILFWKLLQQLDHPVSLPDCAQFWSFPFLELIHEFFDLEKTTVKLLNIWRKSLLLGPQTTVA